MQYFGNFLKYDLLAIKTTAYPICAKNLVPQNFAKNFFAHWKLGVQQKK